MNQLFINGQAERLPVDSESPFRELLTMIRSRYSTESSLVSSVWVNGREISESDERDLQSVPVSTLERVEVFTAHPREMAQDTLELLPTIAGELIQKSQRLAMALREGNEARALLEVQTFAALMDGIQTLTEALQECRRILRIGTDQTADILTAELASILSDILKCREESSGLKSEYLIQLLEKHLPENLQQWCDEGIPALVRSRDS